jgi:hypothetical protein
MLSRVAIVVTVVGAVFAGTSSADAQTTALFLDSQAGDYVGGGVQRTLTPADSTFQIYTDLWRQNDIAILVDGPTFWSLDFAAADMAPLQAGSVYQGATRNPFTLFNSMDVSGDGRGCNQETGRFFVREIAYSVGGMLERLAVDFEQHCEDRGPALFGAIRYNSTISTLVPFDGAYPSYRLQIAPPLHGRVTAQAWIAVLQALSVM